MIEQKYFLYITSTRDHHWRHVLADVLEPLGILIIAQESNALDSISEQAFALIILDASAVNDPLTLVADIRSCKPNSRIVFVTASPTWKEARNAFYTGASDYLRKESNETKLLDALLEVLKRPLPPDQE